MVVICCSKPESSVPSTQPDTLPVPQVLERRGWQGLEEVVRLLNGNEFCVSGKWQGWGRRGWLLAGLTALLSLQTALWRTTLPGSPNASFLPSSWGAAPSLKLRHSASWGRREVGAGWEGWGAGSSRGITRRGSMQPGRLCVQGAALAAAVGRGWKGTQLSGKMGVDWVGSVGAAPQHRRGTDGLFPQGASSSS